MTALCDRNPAALQRARRTYPGLHITTDADEVLTSPDIDAVAIVTPVWTHYELARTALENGKHVFVEKPFTVDVARRPRTSSSWRTARTCGSWWTTPSSSRAR